MLRTPFFLIIFILFLPFMANAVGGGGGGGTSVPTLHLFLQIILIVVVAWFYRNKK
jgi:hypothetical protein